MKLCRGGWSGNLKREKAPDYLMLLAVTMTSGWLWVMVGKIVSCLISPH
jgi:hypothetical protein